MPIKKWDSAKDIFDKLKKGGAIVDESSFEQVIRIGCFIGKKCESVGLKQFQC